MREAAVRTFALGAVVSQEWINLPIGKQHKVFVGKVEVRKDTDALGWEMQGRDSNWIASVSGKHTTIHIPGCQVMSIIEYRHPTLGYLGGAYVVP